MSAQRFREMVVRLWADDAATTATAIADELGLNEDQREVLIPLIAWRCQTSRRRVTREVERSARGNHVVHIKKVGSSSGSGKVVDLSNDPRLAFLDDEIALPDGRYVLWRYATVKDLQARIEMLDKLRGSIGTSIEFLRAKVNQIAVNKVRCLDDLYPKGKAA